MSIQNEIILPRKRNVLAVMLVSTILFSSVAFAFYEFSRKQVTVFIDGKEEIVETRVQTVQELFKEMGIYIDKHDKVNPALSTELSNQMKVSLVKAVPVLFTYESSVKEVWTTEKTVEDFLHDNNVFVKKTDFVSQNLSTPIHPEMLITFKHSFPIDTQIGDKKMVIWSTKTSVKEFLKKNDITFDKDDKINLSLDTILDKKTSLVITKIDKTISTSEQIIPFSKKVKKDNTLLKGETKLGQKGIKGLQRTYYEITYENGKEISKKIVKKETEKQARDEVLLIGTLIPKPKTKEILVESTAYTAYCEGCSGTTAIGINLRKNPNLKVIAVDPNIIPLGTKVFVEGYGYAVAGDTGGAIKGHKVDIFFPKHERAVSWGRKTVKVSLLN